MGPRRVQPQSGGRSSLFLTRQPEPPALVPDQPSCFNIADIESRLPLRSSNRPRGVLLLLRSGQTANSLSKGSGASALRLHRELLGHLSEVFEVLAIVVEVDA